MRSIAGREFARMIERRGWQLLRVSGSHLSTASPAALFACRFPSTAIDR
jgi:predicted RNA binding protein YcfA (HicA-like mRNA interferase family)